MQRGQPLHVKAKKAWFRFEDNIVCLSAGITTDDENGAYTTPNQCNLINEKVIVNGREVKDGNYKLCDVCYVSSDNISIKDIDNIKDVEFHVFYVIQEIVPLV